MAIFLSSIFWVGVLSRVQKVILQPAGDTGTKWKEAVPGLLAHVTSPQAPTPLLCRSRAQSWPHHPEPGGICAAILRSFSYSFSLIFSSVDIRSTSPWVLGKKEELTWASQEVEGGQARALLGWQHRLCKETWGGDQHHHGRSILSASYWQGGA